MKVAIYCRVSTREQTVENQLHVLRQYCIVRGLSVYQEYCDEGVSGSVKARPQLDILMDEAKKRKFDTVLVWKFDRFARSSQHLINALEEFRALGINFISYTENIDTSTPMGQAMFTMIGAMAQLERDLIIERIGAGIKRVKAKIEEKGFYVGRDGRKITSLGRPKLAIDLPKLSELRRSGKSLREIGVELGVSHVHVFKALKNLPENI